MSQEQSGRVKFSSASDSSAYAGTVYFQDETTPPPYPPPLPAHFYFYSESPSVKRQESLYSFMLATYSSGLRQLLRAAGSVNMTAISRKVDRGRTEKSIPMTKLNILLVMTIYRTKLHDVVLRSYGNIFSVVKKADRYAARATSHTRYLSKWVVSYVRGASYTPHKAFTTLGIILGLLTMLFFPLLNATIIGLVSCIAAIQLGIGMALKEKPKDWPS